MRESAALFVRRTRKEGFDSRKYSRGKTHWLNVASCAQNTEATSWAGVCVCVCWVFFYLFFVFFPPQDGMKAHRPSFYPFETARHENTAWAVTKAAAHVPFAHKSWQLFCTGELEYKHLPSAASLLSINVNHESLWTLFWLTFCLLVLSFFFVSSHPPHPPCLSLKLCFSVVCLLAFLCDSVWPLVNPFLSQLALVEQLKSLLHTRLHLPSWPSLPLCLSFCCSPGLFSLPDSYMPYTLLSLCVHVLFTQTPSLSFFWPVAHLLLFLRSVSGPCLFCAHVCPWVLEILMRLCLMRTVDGGLKTEKKYF